MFGVCAFSIGTLIGAMTKFMGASAIAVLRGVSNNLRCCYTLGVMLFRKLQVIPKTGPKLLLDK